MNTDIVIVGAGPAGIFTAIEMIRRGSKKHITIVEKGQPIEKRRCPKTVTKHCVNCRPYCHITTGFSGAGAFSDGKLSLSHEVGGDFPTLIGAQNAQDLIDYARTASSPIAISTPQALTPANITAQIFVEASGINANVVTYSGGSGARNDLIGGHVDVSVGGISTAVGLADQVKIIGIFGENNPVTDIWPDAQVVSDFATDFEMPDLTCHCSIWTTKAMAERNPEVYQMLVDTYAQAIQSDDAATNLKNANQDRFIDYFGPDETAANATGFMKTLEDYAYLLDPANG